MENQNQSKIEKLRLAIGYASIIAAVGITSIAVTMLGLAQMA